MTTIVSIIISDIVPLRDRGVWQGILNIIFATGAGIGAPLGRVYFHMFLSVLACATTSLIRR